MKKRHLIRAALLAWITVTVLAACATGQTSSETDPLEGLNRALFQFNETADRVALKPLAKTYNRTLPKKVRDSVSNFFSNVGDVYTMTNDFLQGKTTAGTEDFMRIAMNTVFGVGGLFDIASAAGLPKHQQDFGQTLGFYGMVPGPYLVLPLLGPSTVRDTIGFVVDRGMDPITYADPVSLRNTLYGLRFINTRAALLRSTDLLEKVALDKYLFIRDAYLQRRQYLIEGDRAELPNYEDKQTTLE